MTKKAPPKAKKAAKKPSKPKLGSGKRFAAFTNKLEKEGYSEESANKIAASAGRKKYGAKKMNSMAEAGKRRKSKK